MFRTEDEYYEAVNELLKTATPTGAYCLAFAEVLHQESGMLPPREILEIFVNCKSVREGAMRLEEIREYQGALPRKMGG